METRPRTYDHLNRLASGTPTSGVYSGQNQQLCMNYDSFGNRTQSDLQTTACKPGTDPATANYSANNQLHTTAAGVFSYDAAGDVLFDGKNYYAYDAEGRVCSMQTSPYSGGIQAYGYVYDAEGRRVAKGTVTPVPLGQAPSCNLSTNGFVLTESYTLGQGGERLTTLAWTGQTSTWQNTSVYAGGALIATYDAGTAGQSADAGTAGGLHFQLTDPLGTRRVQANSAGEAELDCQSLPFGDQLSCFPDPNAPDNDQDEDATGILTGIHFTGKERDSESGLDYFKYRMYSSNMGRWMSPDPSGLTHADLGNPQSLNLYNYVGNNPLSRTDLDGLCWKGFQWACNAVQALDNGVHGLGFQTNASVDREQHNANQLLHHDGIQTEGLSRRQVRKAYKLDMALGSVRSEGDDGFTYATRIRPTAAQARAIWEKATGGKVPYDESMGRFYDMAHKTPIADGGSPRDPANLEPMLHSDHMDSHRENGDFARWGARSGASGEPADVTVEPTVPVEPIIPIEPIIPP